MHLWKKKDRPLVLITGSVIIVYIAVILATFFWSSGWKGSDYIAVTSLAFAILSFVISFWISQRTKEIAKEEATKAALVQSLQEEKESIGITGLRFLREGLPKDNGSYREEIIESLVLAAIFSGSDRARAVVYSVLRDNCQKYGPEIAKAITPWDDMFKQFEPFQLDKKELDLERGNRRLKVLKDILKEPPALSSLAPSGKGPSQSG